MRKIIKILAVIFVCFVIVVGVGFFYITSGLKAGQNLEVNEINLGNVKDGTYTGIFNFKRWSNELQVDIENSKIVDIKIVKDVKIPKLGVSQQLFYSVINQQSTKVDMVAGATVTSKAYLKAIENAVAK